MVMLIVLLTFMVYLQLAILAEEPPKIEPKYQIFLALPIETGLIADLLQI